MSLKKCRDLDKDIRKMFVAKGLWGRTTSRAGLYMPSKRGGYSIRALELEAELQLARRGEYLRTHPEMAEARRKYERLARAGWRNPLSDADYVLRKYGVHAGRRGENEERSASEHWRRIGRDVKKAQVERLMQEWGNMMHYGRLVAAEGNSIAFPASDSLFMDDTKAALLHSAREEQVHGLGAIPDRRRRCRRGCDHDKTAYHVAAQCLTPQYNGRHDIIVYWVLNAILTATDAPADVVRELTFGKSSIAADYYWAERKVKVRAGIKILTKEKLYHNRPDICIHLSDPQCIYVLEVSVAHLQNFRLQERIKRTKYEKNSVDKISAADVDAAPRASNLIDALRRAYRCPVKLAVLVFGAYGEILYTDEFRKTASLLNELGISARRHRTLMTRCCYSAAASTANIIFGRLGEEAEGIEQQRQQ